MWCHQESNRGHKDFQSFALPTELWHLALDCECKVIAFCRIHQIFSQLFFKKINNCDNCDKMVVRDGCGGYKGRTFGTHSLIYPQSRHPAYRHAPAWRSPTSLARWLHGYAPPPGCDFVGGFRSPHVATPPRGAAQHPVRGGCTATHHLRGAILLGDFVPRMSPRPRVAKYGATHGCHPLPGIEITSPLPCAAPLRPSTAPPRSLRRSHAQPRSA